MSQSNHLRRKEGGEGGGVRLSKNPRGDTNRRLKPTQAILTKTIDKTRRQAGGLVAFLFLVVRPGTPSSFLVLVVWPGAPSSVLASSSKARSPSSFLVLVVWPGAPSSVLASSSKARSP